MDPRPLLTVNDVCAKLAISRNTVYRLIEKGSLRPVMVAQRLRFKPEEIDDYLEGSYQRWVDRKTTVN